MRLSSTLLALAPFIASTLAAPYNETYAAYNLNTNQNAQSPLDYDTDFVPSSYTPSPTNWRIPFYTVLMDKFADGDPTNNDFFGSPFEWDWRETNFRFGGDLAGLESKLDYLAGMGIKAIFASGTPWINMLWQADSYSPLDFTTLDPHWGKRDEWRSLIDAVHARGMYYVVDFTVATMGDLIGWEGFQNKSAPFDLEEHNALYKTQKYIPWDFNEYKDFQIDNSRNLSCVFPTLYFEDGNVLGSGNVSTPSDGCKASDFDQYGDLEAFGVHPDWMRQLTKFASVQDRLREWQPAVLERLIKFSCLAIKALDFDAIRIDKSTQVTVDAMAAWATGVRQCAAQMGKNNFFISGEVTGGNSFGALYLGRGRTPEQQPSFQQVVNITSSEDQFFLRPAGNNGLDAVAFHYSIYRSFQRFLGLDGNLQVGYDTPVNFVDAWNTLFVSNDLLNAGTGEIDPRHLYGLSNFDVLRWDGLVNGTQRSAVGMFIASLMMPGAPLVYYGEEQGLYLLDNTANNYLFGRQAMPSNKAWQRHGCYHLGSDSLFDLEISRSTVGCLDDWNSLDHFDPTADVRRLFKQLFDLRAAYPVLNDGLSLVQNWNLTYQYVLPFSNGSPTEQGLWSISRGGLTPLQNFTYNDTVWMLYTNENTTVSYSGDCTAASGIAGPYQSDTTVRNLLYPFENYTLGTSNRSFFFNDEAPYFGCIQSITMQPYDFKALVPLANWRAPAPALTKFVPGHDARIQIDDSTANPNSINVRIEFSDLMDCTSVTQSMNFTLASSGKGTTPSVNSNSVQCQTIADGDITPAFVLGATVSRWYWNGTIDNVADGILTITINNPQSQNGVGTGATDNLLVRKGKSNNVMVFPNSDYDGSALSASGDNLVFTHTALGAEMFRYSVDFGKQWSNWSTWEDTTSIPKSVFQNKTYFWKGNHVIMNYWAKAAGSAATVVHSDYGYNLPRRVPRFLARGDFNRFGFDSDVPSALTQASDGTWQLDILAGWPSMIQLNVYDYDDYFYGDTDGDGVLDRLPPNSLALNFLNMTAPPKPHLSWTLIVDDSTMTWSLQPRGYLSISAILYGLLLFIPFITALFAAFIFMRTHYGIKFNQFGVISQGYQSVSKVDDDERSIGEKLGFSGHKQTEIIGWPEDKNKRRKVLIATLEYEIIDWKIKVKIGGLGVMSSLMGKSMTDVDLIWVVPKVKDIEYPPGEPIEPIEVIIFGEPYLIEVEKHVLDHITYVILDSPVFRAQTKSDPYPPRMDDLSSAIFYSTWNQSIAATVKRNPDIDIYHINDYHGALAPIYLLPKVLPVCLSLHNAEFQGLWPLRTKEEMKEVCSAFNISKEHCTKYVQFGNTFNLLHAAASFISDHQNSIGVAGVSDKYGKRSWARYPALWTLKHVDSLPNPDPSDVEALDAKPVSTKDVTVDLEAESKRPDFKRQAQEWAHIAQNPNADLFVFVGRWSKQKGVDLIADIMPSMLEKYPSIQLIAVGPVIDLYGKFAAEKLARLMEIYPDRVFSKPEFTALPPYLFSGADFALIPSRDEPFGLVAVEFGRKGALGVGSRLGGLGLMPGWWFPVESTSTDHMLSQFRKTIKQALKSSQKERQLLRARSAVQRFPVVEWRQRTEDFHKRSINASRRHAGHDAWRDSDGDTRGMLPIQHDDNWDPVHQDEPARPSWGDHESAMDSPGLRSGNASRDDLAVSQPLLTPPPPGRDSIASDITLNADYRNSVASQTQYNTFLERANRQFARENQDAPDPFLDHSRASLSARPYSQYSTASRLSSVESIATIVDEKQNSPLNKAIETFTDKDGGVTAEFVAKLRGLDSKNSQSDLSIEKFLIKSEEAFFDKVKVDKRTTASTLRHQRDSYIHSDSPRSSFYSTRPGSVPSFVDEMGMLHDGGDTSTILVIPSRLQVFLSRELFGWPLYGLILALGQTLSATSYQIVLLSGSNSESAVALYIIGAVFFGASVVWYILFRFKPSIWVLSLPWFFFSVAFLLIGLPYISTKLVPAHDILSSVATWSYAVASAAGFAFFGLNFGEEAGAATEVWILRACIVQGSQQIWVAALWYWGDKLNGAAPGLLTPKWIVYIVWPLSAVCLLFMILLLFGLPEYYRQTPPKVPNFYATLFRRKLVLWFLFSLVLRDYWLSASYGKNWSFLWGKELKDWQVLILIVIFFIGVWAALLAFLTWLSKIHTWFLAIFAVGIGAPRWCQMLWGVSSVALYVPWAGGAGPWISVSLWLWLGVLDAVQGVGLGMILLQTLSRLHVCATLAFSQMLGSIVVIVARATVPRTQVFPDFGLWNIGDGFKHSPFASIPFWIALVCQIVIVVGYFWYYRKEQLARP